MMRGVWRKYIDVSANTYYEDSKSIISVEPMQGLNWFALFQPFSWHTWLLLCILIPGVGITLYNVRRSARQRDEPTVLLRDCFWDVVVIICWDSVQFRHITWTACILLCFYMPMAMLVITFYMDGYTVALTAPKYSKQPMDTFEQLKLSHMTILSYNTAATNAIKRYLKQFGDSSTNKFETVKYRKSENSRTGSRYDVFINMQKQPDKYVTIEDYRIIGNYLHTFSESGFRKFYKSKQSLSNKYQSFYYLSTFPYKEHFSRKIMPCILLTLLRREIIHACRWHGIGTTTRGRSSSTSH